MKIYLQIALLGIGLLFSPLLSAQNISVELQSEYTPVCSGESVELNVVATGNNLVYQWQIREGRNFVNLIDNENISGSQSPNLNINSILKSYNYRCQISNDDETAFSKEFKTTLRNATFAHHPNSISTHPDNLVSFSVAAYGEALTFQWQVNKGEGFVDIANGKNFTGTQSDILSIPKSDIEMNAWQFRCILTGQACEITELISQPASLTIVEGNNAFKSSASASGTPLLYFAGPTLTGNGVTNAIFIDGAAISVDGTVQADNGSTILGTYNSKIALTGDLEKTGTIGTNAILFEPNDSTIITFAGANAQEVSGNGVFNFHRVEINKASSTDELILMKDIEIRKSLSFGSGDIDLNGFEIDLTFINYPNMPTAACPDISAGCPLTLSIGNSYNFPKIINETAENRIKGAGQVIIENQEIASNNNPFSNGLNLGNMGVELMNITDNSLLGDNLTFIRKHNNFLINGENSLDRSYDIQRTNTNANTDIDFKFHYLENDIPTNVNEEGNLFLFRSSDNGANWNINQTDENDTVNNFARKDDVEDITELWTLAECNDIPQPSFTNSVLNICHGETVTLTPTITGGIATSYIWEITSDTETYTLANTTGSNTIISHPDSSSTQILTVIAFNALGCSATDVITINHTPAPVVDLGNDQFLCENESLLLNAQNAITGTSYAWTVNGNPVGTEQTYTYLSDGSSIANIEVLVTNIASCTAVGNITITGALNPIVDLGDDQIICETGETTTFDAGSDGNQYNWSSGAATQTISPSILQTETYAVTVTNTTTSCASTDDVLVTLSDISLTEMHTNIDCFGEETASIDLTAASTNPNATFSYTWSGTEGFTASTEDVNNLPVGSYDVLVSDNLACTDSIENILITSPNAPLAASEVITDASCFGGDDGQIVLNPTGGTPNSISPLYNTIWTGPNNFASSTEDVSGLMAGDYEVQITDANGCLFTKTMTIGEASEITASLSSTDISCFGAADGEIDLTPANGTPGYTFSWLGPNGFSAITEDVDHLDIGTYTIIISDSNLCSKSFTQEITEPQEIAVSHTITPISCATGNDGAISLFAPNLSDLSFQWSSLLTGALVETGSSIDNLVADTYSVIISTADGCSITETFQLTEPTAIQATASIVNASGCSNNGTIDLSATGGTGALSFIWSNGATTEDINNLGAGNYTVQIMDENSCIYNSPAFSVTAPNGVSIVENITPISCTDGNDGAIVVTPNGGTPDYSFNWQLADGTTSTSANLSGLIAGNYSLTVTDAEGCTSTTTYFLENPVPLNATADISNVSCNGTNDGAITVNVNEGSPPFTYNWSNGGNTQTIENLSAANYTVTITDANSCFVIETFTISEPTPLTSSANISVMIQCANGADGQLNANASGGTPPYSYLWSNGVNTQFNTNISAASYSVTITDANGCTTSETIELSEPSEISISEIITPVSSFNGSDGAVDLTISGGTTATSTYTFNWSGENGFSATTEDISGLIAGNYSVTVLDENSCEKIETFVVTQPNSLSLSLDFITDASCYQLNNGSIFISVSEGTAPYTFSWIGPNGFTSSQEDLINISAGDYELTVSDASSSSTTSQFTVAEPSAIQNTNPSIIATSCQNGNDGSILLFVSGGTPPYNYQWSNNAGDTNVNSNLTAGNYSVTITDDNGCNLIDNFEISQPDPILITETINQVSCFEASDASIILNISGGTPPFNYVWSNGASNSTLTNLDAGMYTVTVSDSNSCTESASFEIVNPISLEVSFITTNANCGQADGSVFADVQGGTAPYSYNWSVPANNTNLLSNVSSGLYTITVTDNTGCTTEATASLNDANGPSISILSTTNTTCNGAQDGEIEISIIGGSQPYLIEWSNGENTSNISNLPAGQYNVLVTDSNACTATEAISLSEPEIITVFDFTTNISCFGADDGMINLTVEGGSPPYSFNWSNGATSQNLQNLSIGTYEVTITDTNSCTGTSSISLTGPEFELSIQENHQNVTCNGANDGTINLTISGGTAPYTYLWSNNETTPNLSGLSANNYDVTLTDAQGCTATASILIEEPSLISIQANVDDISCFGNADGQIELTVTGGLSPYTYSWPTNTNGVETSATDLDAGVYEVTISDTANCTQTSSIEILSPEAINAVASLSDITCSDETDGQIKIEATGGTGNLSYSINNLDFQASNIFENLEAGVYNINIEDTNSCSFEINNLEINAPAPLAISAEIENTSLINVADGSIDLSVTGGTGDLSFNWSTGQITEDLSNLLNGTYSVTLTDENNCFITENFEVSVLSSGILSTNLIAENVSCNGAEDGSIDLEIMGGTGAFTIEWTGSNAYTFTGEDPTNLASGNYSVTITDDFTGMTITDMISISEPTAISGFATATNACFNEINGSLAMNFSGGNPNYSYEINGVNFEQTVIENLPIGNYSIVVTDENMCSFTASDVVISENPEIEITLLSSNPVLCYGEENGGIEVSITGGNNAPNTISWLNEDQIQVGVNPNLSMQAVGDYSIIVTDEMGCEQSASFEISEPDSLQLNENIADALCFGDNTGSIEITNVTGGTGSYNYLWSDASTAALISNLSAANYSLTISDTNGCELTESFDINQPELPILNTMLSEDVTCFEEENGILTAISGGGTAPLTYEWSNGITSNINDNLNTGEYYLTITDANNCILLDTASITQPDAIELSVIDDVLDCFGDNDGMIDLTVSGGNSDYEFAWSNGTISEDPTSLTAGTYTVTITYNNSLCDSIVNANVTEPSQLIVNEAVQNVSCFNDSDASISLNPTGGTAPYSYAWDIGETSNNIDLLAIGIYSCTISDANNCQVITLDTITEPSDIFTQSEIQRAGCKRADDGYISITTVGGVEPYNFTWSNGDNTESIIDLTEDVYSLNIQDANGCLYDEEFLVAATDTTFTANFLAASGLFNVDSVQVNSEDIIQFVDVSVPAPETWFWSFGDPDDSNSSQANPQFSYPNNSGEVETPYTVKLVVSNQFCTDSLEKTIFISNNLRQSRPDTAAIEYLGFTKVWAFPNPTSDVVNLEVELTREEDISIELSNANGYIFERRYMTGTDNYDLSLNVKDLHSGIYFIRVKSLNQIHVLKLIVNTF